MGSEVNGPRLPAQKEPKKADGNQIIVPPLVVMVLPPGCGALG